MLLQPKWADKFYYPEIQTSSIDGCRFYQITDDIRYPSITSVLGRTVGEEKERTLENWRNRIGHEAAEAITIEAGRRGSAVHDLAENYFKYGSIASELATESDVKNFKILIPFIKNRISEWWGMEVCLFSSDLEIAGRCDRICVFDGLPSIIDFKTSKKIKSEFDIEDYFLQTTFYSLAHDEMYGTDINQIVIIMAVDNAFPMIFVKDRRPFIETLFERRAKFH
jgi:genome maintenance exonuclease 1